MELTQSDYNTQSSRHRVFEIAGVNAVSVWQPPSVSNRSLWGEPRIRTYAVKLVDMEHADLFKDALELAGELFEEWSADTGKEITE